MKDKHVSIPMTILSLAIGIIVIFPIIWLVLSSFKPSGELFTYPLHMFPSAPTTEHYKSVLDGGFRLCEEQPVPGCGRHPHHTAHQCHVRLCAGYLPL